MSRQKVMNYKFEENKTDITSLRMEKQAQDISWKR